MGKIKEVVITRFDGGQAFDDRLVAANSFAKSLNFDIYQRPTELIPVRDYEAFQDEGSNVDGIKVANLSVFGHTVSNLTVYAIGFKLAGTGRKLWSSASGAAWVAETFEAADGVPMPSFLIGGLDSSGNQTAYYFATSTSTETAGSWALGKWKEDTATGDFLIKNLGAISGSGSLGKFYPPQAVLGQDGAIYVSGGTGRNLIHKINNDETVTDSVFTVSATYKITNLCLYGNYLAIAIRGLGSSKLLLWNYADAQASEVVELGEGSVMVMENINGVLVTVIDKYVNSTLSTSGDIGAMQIKVWAGGTPEVITEVKAYGQVAEAILSYKYVKNNVLYWYAKIPNQAGGYDEGIWSFGKRLSSQNYALTLHRQIAGSAFEGFWGVGQYFYLPNSNDGSVSRTNHLESYTLTSSMETGVINDGDSSIEKSAIGAYLTIEPLTSGQTVALKYKKQGETSYTSLTQTPTVAVGDISVYFPVNFWFREIQFRIETTNGAKITGLHFRYEGLINAMG